MESNPVRKNKFNLYINYFFPVPTHATYIIFNVYPLTTLAVCSKKPWNSYDRFDRPCID